MQMYSKHKSKTNSMMHLEKHYVGNYTKTNTMTFNFKF